MPQRSQTLSFAITILFAMLGLGFTPSAWADNPFKKALKKVGLDSETFDDLSESFMPTIDVELEHPPSLGLDVTKVAFAKAKGECSEEFVNGLIENFVENGVEVVERQKMAQVLDEIDLTMSGYIDPEDAIALGEMIGPSALVFVEVQHCRPEKRQWREKVQTFEGPATRYYAETAVHFKGSLRIVDLATGRISTAKTVEESAVETVQGTNGCPPYPSTTEVHGKAIRNATSEVHRMFFPWTETKSLRYFKSKKCGLDMAYRMLQIGNLEEAERQSLENLKLCKSDSKAKKKNLAGAHYNVGMSYFMRDDYDDALRHLETAYRLKPGDRIRETVFEVKNAKAEAGEMQVWEDRLVEVAGGGVASPSSSEISTEPVSTSVAARLKRLEDLHAEGLLNDQEYKAKRQEILQGL